MTWLVNGNDTCIVKCKRQNTFVYIVNVRKNVSMGVVHVHIMKESEKRLTLYVHL